MTPESALVEIATNSGPLGGLLLVLFLVGRSWHHRLEDKIDKALELATKMASRVEDLERRVFRLEPRRIEDAPTARLEERH